MRKGLNLILSLFFVFSIAILIKFVYIYFRSILIKGGITSFNLKLP